MAQGEQSVGSPANDLDLASLDRALQRLFRTRAAIGVMPPAPATARGRAGAVLVRSVRRALFWVFPQLDAFHGAVADFAEAQLALMEELRQHLADLDDEIARVRQESLLLSNEAAQADSASQPGGALWLQLVKCQAGIESVRQAMERSPH